MSRSNTETTAPARTGYWQRCGACHFNRWMNDALGECLALGKDVYHEEGSDCIVFERRSDDI